LLSSDPDNKLAIVNRPKEDLSLEAILLSNRSPVLARDWRPDPRGRRAAGSRDPAR
jgi:hypothetical protein